MKKRPATKKPAAKKSPTAKKTSARTGAGATARPSRARATREGGMVKMSVLARLSGVPAATIKHYVNEGLLPAPARTSRNMAYYDPGLVPRIQRIKHLQRTRFLPLKVIKRVLDEAEHESIDETMTATIARVLEPDDRSEGRTRSELARGGLPGEQLDALVALGLVAPHDGEDGERFGGDDLEILRVLGAARKAGLTAEMLPFEILTDYVQSLRALVRAELRMFRAGVLPRAGADLVELTEAATVLSERLVVLLRRKMLVPTLRGIVEEERATPRRAPGAV